VSAAINENEHAFFTGSRRNSVRSYSEKGLTERIGSEIILSLRHI